MHDMTELHERLKRKIERNGRRAITDTIPPEPVRRERSLRACHLPLEQKPLLHVHLSHAYTPELSSRLEHDPNLCDGARRCARILAGYVYRRDRDARAAEITVSYLSRALGRCRRTVQRYLRQLERAGYIESAVIASQRSRLCVGIAVRLMQPLFPKHHAQNWPNQLVKPGATRSSLKHRHRYKTVEIPTPLWALRCMEGVFRAFVKSLPPLPVSP